ncbi:AAA family ATPase [Candidatus Falkowbacteria bacterium CG_4_10_14_0_2_um_filter_48_10]|uniref:Replication-associated recombination protein A n=1 Tax=Candidatus Falkowbacteria bacterium CG23_combo_of_CG06-09_8_20_14_all_49_15 TaxID=1974572 RepID=A0A2G9ZM53_9BACT|nr:MAG: AAA family ATPase [Candidatus Falkowbacteria bacterium CG23_combo_of_CG06-09_8_20_14_all_49_15]PJA07569.1 MAG: AAA family ATPase [Candidatus Falkowbacteria bacterium CG_4_10_14_0_2_um_filter_48_10]
METAKKIPLAERMRPVRLDDFLGQDAVVGAGKMLRQAIAADQVPSLILWGPPGSGKTTLAQIIAKKTQAEFIRLSAVTSGVRDLKEVIKKARENEIEDIKTILFVDEIHRWNKAQQDALLPHVEKGTITLIGATTENPSFEVRGALLSRCRVFVLNRLDNEHLEAIIRRALADPDNGLGNIRLDIPADSIKLLARLSNGDARTALNVLEYIAALAGEIKDQAVSPAVIKEAFQKSYLLYDKNGEEHYNLISALHKALRGSDADAALYWLARLLTGGEDPLYIARRLVRFASEDIGLANSRALEQAVAAYQACHFLGLPECNVILAQVVVYMAKCEKSNELYQAYQAAAQDAKNNGNLPVPLHLRNASSQLMRDIGYGRDYKYSPDYDYTEKQEYLPPELKNRRYFKDAPRIKQK